MEENQNKFSEMQKTTLTPEDGFVPLKALRPNAAYREAMGRKFKGHGTRVSFSSGDPRVHKAFVLTLCSFMILVALILMIHGSIVLPLLFIVAVLAIRNFLLRDIEKQAKEMNIDTSPEQVQKAKEETVQQMRQAGNIVFRETFTEEHMGNLKKTGFLFYAIISGILVIGLSFISVWMGIAALIIVIAAGFAYHALLNFLVKKFQK